MKVTHFRDTFFPVIAAMSLDQPGGGEKPAGRIRELSERDRRALLMHFLDLSEGDRLRLFGRALTEEAITRYVQMLDFSRHALFGVYDDNLMLFGVGHLVFVPKEARPGLIDVTRKARIAEFSLSVLAAARGKGIGTKLFERAALHCRNQDIDVLIMGGLSSSPAMLHLARKTGMEVHQGIGDEDAYLKLIPASSENRHAVANEESFGTFDHGFKAITGNTNWRRRLPPGEK